MLTKIQATASLVVMSALFSAPSEGFEFEETFSGTGPFPVANVAAGEPKAIADYSGNGRTGATDYALWRESLGETGLDLDADGDDGTGTGTPDEVVDQHDFDYWRNNYGSNNLVFGFEEDDWLFSGRVQNTLGSFSDPGGTFDISKDQEIGFVVNPGGFDIYQSLSGLQRSVPVGGRIEYEVEYEDFVLGTPSDDPDARTGITLDNQHIVTQLNFGNPNNNPGPSNVEIIDMQLLHDTEADSWELVATPILDAGAAIASSINLRDAGFLGPEEAVTALDWRLVIDSDEVNGGSNILIEFQLNNSGVFEDYFNLTLGTPEGEGINGIDYPADLASDGTSVILSELALRNVFVDPSIAGAPLVTMTAQPHPFVMSNGMSIDRVFYTSPDVPPEKGGSSAPEPGALLLALVGSLIGIAKMRR